MPRDGNYQRGAGLLLALIVGALTLTSTARAVQSITTPNAAFVRYSLAAGGNSAAITPVASQSVLVMGNQLNVGFRGVGQVTLLRVPSSFLEWVGLESPAGASITSGFSSSVGTHIVYLDFSHTVDIEVNTADTFRIHNGGTIAASGNVTLIW